MNRPKKSEFICTKCKTHEFIPTDIVLQLDAMDPGDPSYPSMFNCEKCDGLMKPKYFVVFFLFNCIVKICNFSYTIK